MFEKVKNLQKRDFEIFVNVIMAFIIKGSALFVSLFTLPAYIRYFDNRNILGVWFTIVSILSWILSFDLGIGNGLRNKLVDALVAKDFIRAKEYISSAYIIITSIAVVFALVGYTIAPYVQWNTIFNISPDYISPTILLRTVRIVFLGILMQFVLRIITSILYALQHSFVPNLLNLISSIMLLIFVLKASSVSAEYNIVMLAYANVIIVNLPLLLATLLVFFTKLRDCMPSFRLFKKKYAEEVMILGGKFFWLQIMAMILFSTNEYLITWLIGPGMVVDYQIYNKIFTLGGILVSLAMTPIWSAVTKAKAECNYQWIKRLNNKLMILGILGICTEVAIVPFAKVIISFWIGTNSITVNYSNSIIFSIYGSLFLWTTIITNMTNGLGKLKMQLIFVTMGALFNIPLAFIAAKLYNSYIAIVIVNIVSLLPYCIIQPIWFNRFIKKKITDIAQEDGNCEYVSNMG